MILSSCPIGKTRAAVGSVGEMKESQGSAPGHAGGRGLGMGRTLRSGSRAQAKGFGHI